MKLSSFASIVVVSLQIISLIHPTIGECSPYSQNCPIISNQEVIKAQQDYGAAYDELISLLKQPKNQKFLCMSNMYMLGSTDLASISDQYVDDDNILYYQATFGMVMPSLVCSLSRGDFGTGYCGVQSSCYVPAALSVLDLSLNLTSTLLAKKFNTPTLTKYMPYAACTLTPFTIVFKKLALLIQQNKAADYCELITAIIGKFLNIPSMVDEIVRYGLSK